MEPPTSEHRGTNLPSAGVRLLKRPTTNGSGGESSLHAVSSRGLGESGMSSKIGAPIIRRVPARPNTAATHQRPRELDKTGSTGQTRSQVVTEPSAATATPHNRTEETLESLDLTSHQLWPSIGGAAGTESGCGQEAWPSISSKGWSSVVKSAPSGKVIGHFIVLWVPPSIMHAYLKTKYYRRTTVVPLLRDHLQIQRNLVSEKRWSSKGGFIVCTVSAFVQGNSGL